MAAKSGFKWGRTLAPAWLVLALSMLPVIWGYSFVRKSVLQREENRFTDEMKAVSPALAKELLRFSDLLSLLRGVVDSVGVPDQERWDSLLRGKEWNRFAYLLQTGFAELHAEGADVSVEVHVAASRKDFVAKPAEWAGRPEAMEAMKRAVGQARPMASAGIRSGDSGKTNIVLCLSVRKNAPEKTPHTRAAGVGSVFAVVNLAELQSHLVKSFARQNSRLEISAPDPSRKWGPLDREFSMTVFGSLVLPFHARPGPTFPARSEGFLPTTVLTVGLILSLLLFGIVAIQCRHRFRIELAHFELTRSASELKERESQIRLLNEELEARIEDRTRDLVAANQALEMEVVERTRAERQLTIALEAANELGRLKGEFISMVSHELRTPLEIVISSAGILETHEARLAAERRTEHFRRIEQAVERMKGLVEDVLLFNRADGGRMHCHPEPVSLPTLCDEVARETETMAGSSRRIEIESSFGSESVPLDPKLLRLILGNLLGNALKYSPTDSRCLLRIQKKEGSAAFTICDHGIGVPRADQGRIFDAFHRGSNAMTRPGNGLGLALTRKCVECHGGTITFESVEGLGTTFTVIIPFTSLDKAPNHEENPADRG